MNIQAFGGQSIGKNLKQCGKEALKANFFKKKPNPGKIYSEKTLFFKYFTDPAKGIPSFFSLTAL